MGTEGASTLLAAVEGGARGGGGGDRQCAAVAAAKQHPLITRSSRLSRFHFAKTARYTHASASRRSELHCIGLRSVKTPGLARGLVPPMVRPRAKLKEYRSHVSEFHSARC
jgi:hypothetical protein